jgi:hypothetical protein
MPSLIPQESFLSSAAIALHQAASVLELLPPISPGLPVTFGAMPSADSVRVIWAGFLPRLVIHFSALFRQI